MKTNKTSAELALVLRYTIRMFHGNITSAREWMHYKTYFSTSFLLKQTQESHYEKNMMFFCCFLLLLLALQFFIFFRLKEKKKVKMYCNIFTFIYSLFFCKHYDKNSADVAGNKGPMTKIRQLAGKAYQFTHSVKKAEGHLKRLGDENDRER